MTRHLALFHRGTGDLVTPSAHPLMTAESRTVQDLSDLRRQVKLHLADVPTLIRTSAYLHGEPPLRLALWARDGRLECRVTDRGPGHPDPTAGYHPQQDPRRAGAGLWLARQTCDDLDMWHTGAAFTVQVATRRALHDRPRGRPRPRRDSAHPCGTHRPLWTTKH
ncbi:ATP-binding protein [Dactylosporangium aurantiacum]|uniref:ATP-binding protein n=1 Tax=Dactylosporangium aurantiacum TaxID=35754 RepID=A0A9Q9IDP1_9ACTN|nr:ATP-binding protein [Dactylosporangium aurantiacum]MDG6107457.1 ATP-binding protein [Dactylosporangium aurantiacum]UWZ54419.1 ATP-binding protein [Dactylosporangium aurantiacum]